MPSDEVLLALVDESFANSLERLKRQVLPVEQKEAREVITETELRFVIKQPRWLSSPRSRFRAEDSARDKARR